MNSCDLLDVMCNDNLKMFNQACEETLLALTNDLMDISWRTFMSGR